MKRLVAFTIAGLVSLSTLTAAAQEGPAAPGAPGDTGTMPAAPPAVEQIPVDQAAPAQTPTLPQFQEALAPHGRWATTPEYGNVWVPSAASDPSWRPYTNGRWAYTEQGWTFVSNDPWGWAPFHYGRWIYYASLGWAWIPGYRWSPAWVSWRYGGGYVGWAPMGPDGIPVSYYDTPSLWLAVRGPYFYRPLYRSYFLPTTFVVGSVFRSTHFVGLPRVGVYYSPPVTYVSRVAGVPVARVSVYTVAPRTVVGTFNPRARFDSAMRSATVVTNARGRWVAPATARPTLRPISAPTYRTPYRAPNPSTYRAPAGGNRPTSPAFRPVTPPTRTTYRAPTPSTNRPSGTTYRAPTSGFRPTAPAYRPATTSYRPTIKPTSSYRPSSSSRSSSSSKSKR